MGLFDTILGRTKPVRKASTTACTRFRSPSLARTRPTWDLPVASETKSRSAIV